MSIPDEVIDKFFTYDVRLESFQRPQTVAKPRAASRTPKSMTWPHEYLHAADVARAGFFYYPTQNSPDTVVCFLCKTSLDGWERGDSPLVEHLKYSPECGWAIVTAVEAKLDGYDRRCPNTIAMVEARKATFANKWPYEYVPHWRYKTKQLAEAGWKYTPSPESNDMVTCVYCQLAIYGWGRDHDPAFQHRSNCIFFQSGREKPAVPASTPNTRAARRKAGMKRASTMTEDPTPKKQATGDKPARESSIDRMLLDELDKLFHGSERGSTRSGPKAGYSSKVTPEPELATGPVKNLVPCSTETPSHSASAKSATVENDVLLVKGDNVAASPPKRRGRRQ